MFIDKNEMQANEGVGFNVNASEDRNSIKLKTESNSSIKEFHNRSAT